LLGRERLVDLRQDPVGRTLEDVQLTGSAGDGGQELHCAGGGADHRDAFAVEAVVVIPTRRMEHGARERVETGDVGIVEIVEHAERADQDVGFDLFAGGRDRPATACTRRPKTRR
jgi:hypothetical protein